MNEPLNSPKYRSDIDGLRAIAILSVVAFHAFPSLIRGGFVGVDIFFVISGYLISTIIFSNLTQTASFSFKTFYARRIKRIFPALILVMFACYLLGWFALSADEYTQLGKHIAGGAGFISNFILWNESGYFDKAAEFKPLQHLWSLGVEEQFYLLWPFLVYFAWKKRFNLLMVALLIAVLSFLLNAETIHTNSIAAFYLPVTRFWELMLGGLLAYLNLNASPIQQKNLLPNTKAFLGISLIIFSILVLNKNMAFPGWWALLPTLGAFLLISAGPTTWINRSILSHPILVWFGLISFPLYLWHWPLLSFSEIIESGNATASIQLIAVLISILLAWVTYKIVEKPIRAQTHTTIKVSALCIFLFLMGLIGLNTFERNGLKFRSAVKKVAAQEAAFAWGPERLADINCEKKFPFESGNYYFCLLTKTNREPTVVIIGDSHANHLYWGLSDFYQRKNQNLVLLAGSGCLPFFNTESAMTGTKDHCKALMNKSLDYAINSPTIKTIILTNYSNNATILATTLPASMKGSASHSYIKFSNTPNNTDYQEIYRLAMTAMLNRLVKSNKEIIYILDVPDLGFDPKTCVNIRPLPIVDKLKNPCATNKKEYEDRNATYLSITKSVLKLYPTVKVFEPSNYLCDKKYCWGIQNGNILYSDSNHLSFAGSLFIGGKFALKFSQ